jgi:hypothetical protein
MLEGDKWSKLIDAIFTPSKVILDTKNINTYQVSSDSFEKNRK